jgi:hypothetical protein
MTGTKQSNSQPGNPKNSGKEQGQQQQNQQKVPEHQGRQKQP